MENQSKEYAKDLVWKYYHILEHIISNEYSKVDWQIAKQCALICINELLEYTKEARFPMNSGYDFHEPYDYDYFLLDVKEEIKKL